MGLANKTHGEMKEALHIPACWDDESVGQKRKNTKKQKQYPKRTKYEEDNDEDSETSLNVPAVSKEDIIEAISSHVGLSAQKPGQTVESGIYLEGILSFFSYHELLTNMFSHKLHDGTNNNIPLVTKQYEEAWMRECGMYEDDEPCVMGQDMCECMQIDDQNPFVGVQFKLPVQMDEKGNAQKEIENKLCVLCCRKQTQSLFYDALFNQRSYACLIQLYGNISDEKGEYSRHVMLSMPSSGPINTMPLPIVSHQRNRYSVQRSGNGLRYIIQHRVSYESFCPPCP